MNWRKVFSLQSWSEDRKTIKARQVGWRNRIAVPTSIRPFIMNGQLHDALCESCRPKAAEYIMTYDGAKERSDAREILIVISIIALLIVGIMAGAYFVSSCTTVRTLQSALPPPYPVKLQMLYINEVEIPVKNCAAYYPNATSSTYMCDYLNMIDPSAESFAPRTFLGFNANVTDETYYTSIKVYDDRNIMIGQFVWDPFNIEQHRGASQVDWRLPLYPTSNPVFVHLQRPLTYNEWIWVRVYYDNRIIGEWGGSVA